MLLEHGLLGWLGLEGRRRHRLCTLAYGDGMHALLVHAEEGAAFDVELEFESSPLPAPARTASSTR